MELVAHRHTLNVKHVPKADIHKLHCDACLRRRTLSVKTIPSLRYRVLAAVAMAAIASLIAFLMFRDEAANYNREQLPVSISTIVYPGSVPLHVAKEMGFFEDEGLDVTLVPFSSGKAGLEQVLQNKLDYCIVAELPLTLAALERKPFSILATIFSAERDHRLIARADRGITSPTTLRGKTIATAPGTTADLVLDLILRAGEVERSEITIVPLTAEEMPNALVTGRVDAASTWEPYLHQAATALKGNSLVFDAFDVQGIFSVTVNLVSTRATAHERPEEAARLLRALASAQQYIRSHPEESMAIAARSSGLSISTLRDLWRTYRFELRLDQSLLISLEDTSRWVIKRGDTRAVRAPNFLDYVHPDHLMRLDAGAVRIIQ